MGLLKRKEEKTEVISVRVPGSAKAEFDELRQRAEARLQSGEELERGDGADHQADQCGASRGRRHWHRPIRRGANAAAVRCSQADQ
jgi:hypothetical protein